MTENTTTPAAIRETVQAARHFEDILRKWDEELAEILVDADPATRADVLRRFADTVQAVSDTTASIATTFQDAGLAPDADRDCDDFYAVDGLDDVVGVLGQVHSALNRAADHTEGTQEDTPNQ